MHKYGSCSFPGTLSLPEPSLAVPTLHGMRSPQGQVDMIHTESKSPGPLIDQTLDTQEPKIPTQTIPSPPPESVFTCVLRQTMMLVYVSLGNREARGHWGEVGWSMALWTTVSTQLCIRLLRVQDRGRGEKRIYVCALRCTDVKTRPMMRHVSRQACSLISQAKQWLVAEGKQKHETGV